MGILREEPGGQMVSDSKTKSHFNEDSTECTRRMCLKGFDFYCRRRQCFCCEAFVACIVAHYASMLKPTAQVKMETWTSQFVTPRFAESINSFIQKCRCYRLKTALRNNSFDNECIYS
eukprot:4972065-Amphidinium_carterae.1